MIPASPSALTLPDLEITVASEERFEEVTPGVEEFRPATYRKHRLLLLLDFKYTVDIYML